MLAIYKASAGSGKTFTLAYEYIKMLLGVKDMETGRYALNRHLRDRHRHILAVTFTNKATDEMKRRIIHELAVLSRLEPNWTGESPYLDRLCEELHCRPDALRTAAAAALRQLLFDFNFFQVSTIDSFFQIILRTFAREVDIAGNYEVDLDNDRAIGQGVRELFDSLAVNSGSADTRRLVQWISRYLIGELAVGRQISIFNRQSQVHGRFLGFIKKISNDDFSSRYGEMMDYLSDPERLADFAKAIAQSEELQLDATRKAAASALEVIEARGYDSHKSLKVSAYLLKQLRLLTETGQFSGSSKTVQKVHDDISAAYGKALAGRLALAPDAELDDAIALACRTAVEGDAALKMYKAVRANLFVLGLLERVYFHINRYRNDNNTIFLSDTNALLREIIGDESEHGTPFVYERVGLWINHFLIDEFQDTSQMQWDNLNPLLHEGQDNGHDSLIIGDEKQCIYRFRFSDPTLLQSEVQRAFGPMAQRQGDNEAGNTNWRSSADVVAFNNDLFSSLSRTLGFEDIYSNVCQRISPAHSEHRGYVSLSGIEASLADEFRGKALEIMTQEIVRELRSGYRPCDIAILTRFRSEGAAAIAHLMEAGAEIEELRDVRIMSDDALFVDSAPAVRLIVSVMRFLAMPSGNGSESVDEATSATARRRIRQREISSMINRFEHLLSQGLTSEDALRRSLESMAAGSAAGAEDLDVEDVTGSMACFNVPSLVERIIVRFISDEVAENQNMYISAFVDVVTDYCSRGAADLHSFLHWWDDTGHTARISAPLDERAIRVMTIHKSKGLEFKCVHVPFIDSKMVDFSDLEWFDTEGCFPGIDPQLVPPMIPLLPESYMESTPFALQYLKRCREQLLDELNVLYVAMTRAVDELIVGYRLLAPKEGSVEAGVLLRNALLSMEMLTDEPAESDEPETEEEGAILAERFYRGSPTVASAERKSKPTALDPKGSFTMRPYQTADRDDLWENLDIERYLDYGEARERGIVLHDVLARVASPADLPAAIRYCSYRGRLPKEEAAEVEAHLASQLQREEIRPWFEGFDRVLRERPLVLADGSVRRPDRVVWTADGHVDVIDYKFGAERPKLYARQVKQYMDALARIGHTNLRGFIWYVDTGAITRV